MKRWSASRSCEYCSDSNTPKPSACGAVKNCPESNVSADALDTVCEAASTYRALPDVFCVLERIPIVFSDVHRKTPSSDEHREVGYTLQATVWDGRCDTNPAPAQDESLKDQTRRKILSGRWRRVGLHICESVFFRFELRIVAFLPCLGSPESDFSFMQNRAKSLDTDRGNDSFGHQILTQFFKRPAFERAAQKVWRAFGCLGDKGLVIFGKFCRATRPRFLIQCFKAVPIKFLDDCTNMMFGVMNQFCDSRHFIALIGGENHLSSTNFDPAGASTQNPLNSLAFVHAEVSGIQTHKKSLSMKSTFQLFLRVCLYNTELCIAQLLNIKKLN
jgi:hypothetical protein